jgi:predicted RNA-binding Zn ribbon-like protein
MAPREPAVHGADALALELVNAGRSSEGSARDVLSTPAELAGWLKRAGLAPAGPIFDALRSPATARILLDEARRLRLDLERLFEAFSEGRDLPGPAVFGLNRVLGASCTSLRLEAEGGAPTRLTEHQVGLGILTILGPVALSAARLLTSAEPDRLRQCASSECRLWFVDTSKAGRRRWCSMARCGNRAKAARHRRRARAS